MVPVTGSTIICLASLFSNSICASTTGAVEDGIGIVPSTNVAGKGLFGSYPTIGITTGIIFLII